MERMFKVFELGSLTLSNRFVLPPLKLAYGKPDGTVTDRQLTFYRQIAKNGPALLISEPVAVTQDGKEHPKQLCVHLPDSASELKKVADAVHKEGGMISLHLNHGGAAANPAVSGTETVAPSSVVCPVTGKEARALTEETIASILEGYRIAAQRAVEAGFDAIEIQCGHGYLISQFLNSKINKRTDRYGEDRALFAREALNALKAGAPGMPMIIRISGNEMSPEYGISQDEMLPLFKLAQEQGAVAVHVGMGSSCFSPPWYFHHGSLPEKPQMDALAWVRKNVALPIIAAGRMGREEKIKSVLDANLADMIALGRPLIACPGLIEAWRKNEENKKIYCGYCIQGCLPRVRTGEGIGCNINPAVGRPELPITDKPMKVLVAGGGPAGMSAAFYLHRRGHDVTLAERGETLGGQFSLAWQAPGKERMGETLSSFERVLRSENIRIITKKVVDNTLVSELGPDLLVWAAGAYQNIPEIPGLESVYSMTSIDYFKKEKTVQGPRVLVIGAGRIGVEIAEKLGREGFEAVATKRTDPIGSAMEPITKALAMKRIEGMKNVSFMPHTAVKRFFDDRVEMERDGESVSVPPFQTVILASGMLPVPVLQGDGGMFSPRVEVIGDANKVMDILNAVEAGYQLAVRC
jgi:2,4-dienoyl-CoA reductase-like NADH-dependent reductase (Old Yellow Enzyme family)/thioredoxin reductase